MSRVLSFPILAGKESNHVIVIWCENGESVT